MIHVHSIANWLEAKRETSIAWRSSAFVRDLVPPSMVGKEPLRAWRNGVLVSLDDEARAGDHVTFCVQPAGAAVALAGQVFAATAGYRAVGSVRSFIRSLRADPPKIRDRDDDSSALYGFEGPVNNRVEGLPIPVYYGLIRAGGQIVNEFVENKGPLGSFYNVLVSFGEGPAYSICGLTADTPVGQPRRTGATGNDIPAGLLINGIDGRDLDNVEMHVRLGTLEQEPIQGFERTNATIAYDVSLTAPEAQNQAENDPIEYVLGLNPTTAENGVWTTYGVTHSTAGEVDAVTLKITFPLGLYKNGAGGAALSESFVYAVRYIELDGGGAPITSGGYDYGGGADGYVRLRRSPQITAKAQGSLSYDFSYTLYDPQTYTPPTLSKTAMIDNNDTTFNAAYAQRTSTITTPWTAGADIDEVSAQVWVCLRPHYYWNGTAWVGQRIGSFYTDYETDKPFNWAMQESPLFEWWDSSNLKGFRFSIGGRAVTLAPGNVKYRALPTVTLWDGTTGHTFWEGKGEIGDALGYIEPLVPRNVSFPTGYQTPDTNWRLVTFTYKANAVQTLFDRVRIYVDGEMVHESIGTYNLKAPTTANLYMGRQANSTTSAPTSSPAAGNVNRAYLKGFLDELVWWHRELEPTEVERSYNSGRGKVFSSTEDDTMVSLWHLSDNVSGTGQTLADAVGTNPFTTVTDGAAATFDVTNNGILEAVVPTNTPKKSRYRVEVMRAASEYTNNVRVEDAKLTAVTEHVEKNFAYPTSSLMGLRIQASDQIQGAAPDVTALLGGRICPVWDGISTVTPTFRLEYTANPAWIAADMILSKTYGFGAFFDAEDIDVQSAKDMADFCAELVYDLRPENRVTMEPLGVSPATPGRIVNIQYDSGLSDPTTGIQGGLILSWQTGTTQAHIPDGWVVGSYLGFSGLEDDSHPNINVDLNVPGSDGLGGSRGFRIYGFVQGSNNVLLSYDYLTLGAPWTDGQAYSAQLQSGEVVDGIVMRREPRAEFNGGFDEDGSAWDALVDVCAVGRSVPLRIGTRISFATQNKRTAIDVLSMGSQVRGTFEVDFTGPSNKENAIDLEFNDKALNYERSVASIEHPSVQDTASLSRLRRKSMRVAGITNRSQGIRHAAYLLELNDDVRRLGSFKAAMDSVTYRPGDVIRIANDVMPRGVSGRFQADAVGAVVYLDREFELLSGREYVIAVRQPIGTQGIMTRGVDEGVTGPATHPVGAAITLQSAFSPLPVTGDPYIIYEQGTQFTVQITSASTGPDLVRTFEWSEYVDAPYELDDTTDILPDLDEVAALTSEPSGQEPNQTPLNVIDLGVLEVGYNRSGRTVIIQASWTHDASTAGIVGSTSIQADGFEAAVTTGNTATFEVEDVEVGDVIEVEVVPVSHTGQRKRRGRVKRVAVLGFGKRPDPPSGIAATMDGDKVVYSWTLPNDKLAVECRRGGWIAGQPVFTAAAGSTAFGPTRDWADGTLYFCCKDSLGMYSDAVAYEFAADLHPPSVESGVTYPDGSVAVWASGDTLVGVSESGGVIQFSGSALVGTYTTPAPALTGRRPRWLYLESVCEAEHVHPLTWDEATHSWASLYSERWTWEGPTYLYPGETPNASVAIEFRLNGRGHPGAWGPWQSFRPGLYLTTEVQFRLSFSRPTVGYDVIVAAFTSKVRARSESTYEKTPQQTVEERLLIQ